MIQLLGLRSFTKEGKEQKYDTFFEKNWRAQSVSDILENFEQYVALIPENERFNIYFTANNCTAKKREFLRAETIFFDIDKIDVTRAEEYVTAFCSALQIKRDETGIVLSGHGLHFYVGLMTPIVDKNFYTNFRDHYKAILNSVAKTFNAQGLPHELDPSVFDARRLMRMPGTLNRKPGREEVMARVLQAKIIPINFDITLASGIPLVKKEDQIDPKSMAKFARTDNKAILEGCGFFKDALANPASVNEPQWYALLSIAARMENGNTVCHTLSKGHPSYSPQETELKIQQALSASGPRTCASINQIWGKCAACPNFQKVTSPILLRGKDTIPTEHTGFHNISVKDGIIKIGEPNYKDLRTFFERKNKFVSHNKFCWVWTGTHWTEMPGERLENFAQEHFDPFAKSHMTEEFKRLVLRSNLIDPRKWSDKCAQKVNFRNGVLDLKTMVLGPHDPELGFKQVLPYDYDPDAQAPITSKFLMDVMGGKQELVLTLLEFIGYALSGDDCRFQKALVLEGDGQNGKSTFIEIFKAVAGEGSYQALGFQELNQIDRRSTLDGALFNITEETPSKMMDTTTFKNLVSGGELSGRKLYKDSYVFRNRAKLVFSCNALPVTGDTSHGFFRRFLIAKFSQVFSFEKGNVDVDIQKKMMGELPGIFNLAMMAYKELVKRGAFTKQTSKDEDIAEYTRITDSLADWFHNNVQLEDAATSKRFVLIDDLYADYKAFCEKTGIEPRETLRQSLVEKRLRSLIPDYEARISRKMIEGVRKRTYAGIVLEESRV